MKKKRFCFCFLHFYKIREHFLFFIANAPYFYVYRDFLRIVKRQRNLPKNLKGENTVTIFERVKSSVTPEAVAMQYGLHVTRNYMICCPFHDDRHPSMKLNDDYFYCFGCGTYGDVIDFVSRLFGISPMQAAVKLANNFNVPPCASDNSPGVIPKYPLIKQFRDDERYCFRVLCDYLHILEEWKIKYAPKTPEDEIDDRFTESCQMLDWIEYLVDTLTVGELPIRVEAVQELLSDDKIPDLEKRVVKIREEEQHE